MARRLNPWLALVAVACLAITFIYLPPRRGAPPRSRFWATTQALRPDQQHTAELAAEWQRVDAAVRLFELRRDLVPEIDRRRVDAQPTIAVRVVGDFTDAARDWFPRALTHLWRDLGLGTTKIGVGIVIQKAEQQPRGTQQPRRIVPTGVAYLLPDTLDRHTCIAYAAPRRNLEAYLRTPSASNPQVDSWLRRVLGPCAFLAAFGKPSPGVERWLSARAYDLAADVTWDKASPGGRDPETWWFADRPPSERRWMWNWLYSLGPTTVGCAGRRATACARYVLRGSENVRPPHYLIAPNFDWRQPALPGTTELLSAAVQEFGWARFARFWTSSLPVDSAFAVAMDTTVGEWMLGQQRAHGTTLDVGPAAPLSSTLIGLLLATAAVAFAALTGCRRQVA